MKMGRSVDYLRDSIGIAFIETHNFLGVDEGEYTDGFEWDQAVEFLRDHLQELWPSLTAEDKWEGREVHIIASNDHAIVGVSAYGNLTSISIAVNGRSEYPELAEAWIRRIASKFEDTFGNLKRIGRFSNGECVYERTA
jgi:HPt (histidine-containing phosphotransfer) domain-containing protein